MNILGIGTVFARGFSIADFEAALRAGWQKPGEIDATWAPGNRAAAYTVDLDKAPDKTPIKKIRRSDKLSKMSVLAAAAALSDSGLDIRDARIGIIVATGFGAHVTTFGFLDDILDYGDAAVSPTTFSNSVHNAAASYVASSFAIKGPTLTVTQFQFSFQSALQLAKAWIDQGRCRYVLVGGVDQYGDVLGYVSRSKLAAAEDSRIRPFSFGSSGQVPGEGAAFILTGGERTERTYCMVRSVMVNEDRSPERADIQIVDSDGLSVEEASYRKLVSADTPVAAYSPIFGSMMTGSAFNTAAAALMLKNQIVYASPVTDNPHGLRVVSETRPTAIGSVSCIGYDCGEGRSEVRLERV